MKDDHPSPRQYRKARKRLIKQIIDTRATRFQIEMALRKLTALDEALARLEQRHPTLW